MKTSDLIKKTAEELSQILDAEVSPNSIQPFDNSMNGVKWRLNTNGPYCDYLPVESHISFTAFLKGEGDLVNRGTWVEIRPHDKSRRRNLRCRTCHDIFPRYEAIFSQSSLPYHAPCAEYAKDADGNRYVMDGQSGSTVRAPRSAQTPNIEPEIPIEVTTTLEIDVNLQPPWS